MEDMTRRTGTELGNSEAECATDEQIEGGPEWAERVREHFRNIPGFMEFVRQRREAAEAADPSSFISHEEIKRKYGIKD